MNNTIKVSKGLFSKCRSIEAALNLAENGDTIEIANGRYKENLVITKNVTLIGELGSTIEGHVILKQQGNIELDSITISSNETIPALTISSNKAHLKNCIITGDIIAPEQTAITIEGCIITPLKEAITFSKKAVIHILNSIIKDSPKDGLQILNGSYLNIVNSEVADNKNQNITVHHASIDIESSKIKGRIELINSQLNLQNSEVHRGIYRAIDAKNHSVFTISNCDISSNFINLTDSKGSIKKSKIHTTIIGIQKIITCYRSELDLDRCEIYNSVDHGLYISDFSTVTINDCKIHGNKAPNIYASRSNVRVINSNLSNSQSGIIVDQSNIEIQNTQITNHREYGILTLTEPSQVDLIQSEVQNNTLKNTEKHNYKIYFTSIGGRFLETQIEKLKKDLNKPDLELFDENPLEKNKPKRVLAPLSSPKVDVEIEEKITTTQTPVESMGLTELNKLTGLTNIKQQMTDLFKMIEFNKELEKFDLNDTTNMIKAEHSLLFGNPGTGKTTVANILGGIYKELGLLSSGHVVQVNREKLVGEYIGATATKTQAKIDEAMGGVLFIDEAYALTNKGSSNDFGPEAIEVILEAMENRRGEFIVVAAGYQKEMQQFLEINPGLKSRFTRLYELEDYTPDEMVEIANSLIDQKNRFITNDAQTLLHKHFTDLWRKRDAYFSNARLVRNYVDNLLAAQMKRCIDMPSEERTKEKLQQILLEDVETILQEQTKKDFDLPVNEELLDEYVAKLNELIGLQSVKDEIQKLITLTRYYKEEKKDLTTLSNHMVLTGNPGTGKTEVARLIAKIYQALGIVERGDLVEVSRDHLVSQYSGETEKITADIIQKSMNGTLFIDEAYQLTQYGTNDSGHKVIEILLKYMEDHRGQFNVIVAGYPDKMEQFLDSNAGLRRRFVRHLTFEDYTPEDLISISQLVIKKQGYQLAPTALAVLTSYYEKLYRQRDHTFGNAGLARNKMLEAIKNVDYRIANLSLEERNGTNKTEILIEDLL